MRIHLNIALIWFTTTTLFSLPFFVFNMDFATAFLESTSALTSIGITSISKDDNLYFYRSFLALFGGGLFLATLPYLISTSDSFKFAIHENISIKKFVYTYFFLFIFSIILYLFYGENILNSATFSALAISTTGGILLPNNLIFPTSIIMFLTIVFPFIYIFSDFKIKLNDILKREQFQGFLAVFVITFFYLILNNIPINVAFFYILSFISTSGFITENFFNINSNAFYILFILSFIGSLIGSVGGGVKIFRVIMLFKILATELKHALYPRMVTVIKLNNSPAPQKIIGKVLIFFFLYTSGIFVLSLIFSSFGIDYEYAAAMSFSLFTTVGVLPMELKEIIFNSSPFLKIIIAFVFIILRLKIFIFFLMIQALYEHFFVSEVHSWKKQ